MGLPRRMQPRLFAATLESKPPTPSDCKTVSDGSLRIVSSLVSAPASH
jgi:hypothetical protein